MNANRRIQLTTFEEFCWLTRGRKADLVDGVIYIASPESPEEKDLRLRLTSFLEPLVKSKQLGAVYGPKVAWRLSDTTATEPDLFLVPAGKRCVVEPGWVEGVPELVLEIVSPSSVDLDHVKKHRQYEVAGAAEYWIIDPLEQKVLLWRLDGRSKYAKVRPRKGAQVSNVVPGFSLTPDWLWPQTSAKSNGKQVLLLGE